MRTTRYGPPGAPAVLAVPGAGTTGELLSRLFGPALAGTGLALLAADYRLEAASDAEHLADLDAAVRRHRPVLLAGVSLGAHLVTRWTADHGDDPVRPGGLLLCAPAWTGAPAQVAALSVWSARRVEELGLDAVLAETRQALADGVVGDAAWVARELLTAWPAYGQDALVRQLGVVAAADGPSPQQLAAVDVPVGVLGWPDDPWHPLAVARRWTSLLPGAALTVVGLAEPGDDRAVVGRGALTALRSAGWRATGD